MKNYVLIVLTVFPLLAFAQLINGDFENIDTVTLSNNRSYRHPTHWNFGYSHYGTEITSDSYSGNNAVKLWSWYFMQSNEELHYGDNVYSGVPLNNRPNKLLGYYKFIDPNIQPNNIPDSAYVNILLTKYNHDLNVRDTIAFTEHYLGEQNSYTLFEVALNYRNAKNPDTLQLSFRTSAFFGTPDSRATCNFLYLDDLSLNYTSTSTSNHYLNEISIYPNPTKEFLHIKASENIKIKEIELFNMDGKKVKIFNHEDAVLDISQLVSGTYFLKISTDSRVLTKKIIIY